MLTNKKILLGISGSIAAYKAAIFVRLLVKEGTEVKVVMTESAKDFVSPLTLATLSKNPVESAYFDESTGEWTNHVELGLWADLMIVAPASANTIGKMANGICDNLLLATYLSAKCPVMFAPAMDLDMFVHPSTKQNIIKLQSFGNILIDAEEGELASGLNGKGRMAEPEVLLTAIQDHFGTEALLKNKKVLITSGPTQEAIDPVRFIGNHSSGKMGAALVEACLSSGAQVTMIAGSSSFYPSDHARLNIEHVKSAQEMFDKAQESHDEADIVIFAAAVADYKPETQESQKIKKEKTDALSLKLIPNPDIALELGKVKKANQIHVGFALETDNEKTNANDKLRRKNFDLIVMNSLREEGAGFMHDTNKVFIFDKHNKHVETSVKSKKEIAFEIIHYINENIGLDA